MVMASDKPGAGARVLRRRRILALGGLAALALGLSLGGGRLLGAFDLPEGGIASPAVLAVALAYVVLLAVPFVPGAEIGVALLAMYGAAIAPLVWGATVSALLLAYVVGRLVPARVVGAGLGHLGLARAQGLVLALEPLGHEARLERLVSAAPARLVPWLLRHRHLALVLALNMPGNSLLGGGGGIALAAGLSRLYAPLPFAIAVALGVLPVPLAVVLLA